MKFLASCIPILALFPKAIDAIPTPINSFSPPLETKPQNGTWRFDVYQNTRCTGEPTPFSGSGTSACMSEILNGGGLATIKIHLDPNCTVSLYGDEYCDLVSYTGSIDQTTSSDCEPPPLGDYVASVAVNCG